MCGRSSAYVSFVRTLEEITYEAGCSALSDQESIVAGIRQRTGTLLAAHALVASFLGATTVRDQGLQPLGWVALLALVVGLVVAAVAVGSSRCPHGRADACLAGRPGGRVKLWHRNRCPPSRSSPPPLRSGSKRVAADLCRAQHLARLLATNLTRTATGRSRQVSRRRTPPASASAGAARPWCASARRATR
jgi:hypothetical protein